MKEWIFLETGFVNPSGVGVKIYSSPALVGKYQHISTCEIHLIQPSQGAGEADLKIWHVAFMRICENEFVSPLLDLTLQTYDCESALIGR